MDSSNEESDSRTAAFSRKRKQPSSLTFEQYASDSAGKRLRLDHDSDEQSGRCSSRDSGEFPTSTSSIRRPSKDSGTVTEDSEVVGLEHRRASKFGWNPFNGKADSDAGDSPYSPREDLLAGMVQPRRENGMSLDDVANMSIGGSPADNVFGKMNMNQPLEMADYQILAQYLYSEDLGLTPHAIQHSGLKAAVLSLLLTKGLDRSANIAGVLGAISRCGDYSAQARSFLLERSKQVRYLQKIVPSNRSPFSGAQKHQNYPESQTYGTAEPMPQRSLGLVKFGDLRHHSENLHKTMQKNYANITRKSGKQSLEECMRSMIVHKEASHKKAARFLTQFYQGLPIALDRLSILQGLVERTLSNVELRNAMANTTGFLRPIISTDIADILPKGVLSVPVVEIMNESSDLSFAQAILLETQKATPVARTARHFLQTFVKISFVGGHKNVSVHSREGLKNLTQSTSHIDGDSSIIQKMSTFGVASLTLDELETLMPRPTTGVDEQQALKMLQDKQYIQTLSKRATEPFKQLVAWNLLQVIKTGSAPPDSRAYLDAFVYALQGGGDHYSDMPEVLDLDVETDNLTEGDISMHGALPTQSQLQTKRTSLSARNDRSARAPHPLPPKPSYDHEQVDHTTAADTTVHGATMVNSPLPKLSHDYGELARTAAAGANGAIASVVDLNSIRLCDLSNTEQDLQRRYFHITYDDSLVRCLCCGKEGHMKSFCPSRTCAHCNAVDDHFSGACPTNQHCERCRRRGHTTAECTILSSSLMRGMNYTCDLCGRPDDVEEECSDLWRNSIGEEATIVQVPQKAMHVSCYNCGASGRFAHWGDDCPGHSAYDLSIRTLNPTWSKKFADKFVLSTSLEKPHSGTARGSVQSYQLAMLNDM